RFTASGTRVSGGSCLSGGAGGGVALRVPRTRRRACRVLPGSKAGGGAEGVGHRRRDSRDAAAQDDGGSGEGSGGTGGHVAGIVETDQWQGDVRHGVGAVRPAPAFGELLARSDGPVRLSFRGPFVDRLRNEDIPGNESAGRG